LHFARQTAGSLHSSTSEESHDQVIADTSPGLAEPRPGSCRLATRSLSDEEIRAIADSVYRSDNAMRFESVRYAVLMFERAGYSIARSSDVRLTARASRTIVLGGLVIDPNKRTVYCERREIALKSREFDLLEILARHPGQVFIRAQLLDIVWPRSYEGEERTVDVHVARLRRKLGEPQPPQLIITVHGIGYKVAAPRMRPV
jgi:DNA-binding response OmpR family regulator